MTTPVAEGGTTPAAAIETPAATPATTAATQAESPAWLPDRLARAEEQARTKLLQELGVTDTAKAKAALAAAKKAEDDAKSTGEKLGETNTKLAALEQENAQLKGAVETVAKARLAQLTDPQRRAITALAGDGDDLDASLAIELIESLAPTWSAPAAAAATTAAPVKPATPASGTAPPPNAPPGTVVSEPNHKEVHAALLKQNPFAAAEYGLAHAREVFPEQQ